MAIKKPKKTFKQRLTEPDTTNNAFDRVIISTGDLLSGRKKQNAIMEANRPVAPVQQGQQTQQQKQDEVIPGVTPGTIARTQEERKKVSEIAQTNAARSQSNAPQPQAAPSAQQQQAAGLVGDTSNVQTQGVANSNPLSSDGLDIGQALGAGLAAAVPGAVGSAAAGAIAGGVPTAGLAAIPGALIGAGVGAIGGFLVGVRSNIKKQLSEDISAQQFTLTKGERNLRAIVTDTNRNPQNAMENLQLFNMQLSRIDQANMELFSETSTNLNKFLGEDGTVELERYEAFNSAGGQREFLIRAMQQAILQPNANVNFVTMEDMLGDVNG